MTIREEFEQAFDRDYHGYSHWYGALAGARWMAERCAKEVENRFGNRDEREIDADLIRKLAKEL